jgi:hypothetical protein
VKRAADTYDAVERWAAFPTTDLERLAKHSDPELRAMLGDVHDELIDEIRRRTSIRRNTSPFDDAPSFEGT